MLQKLLIFTVVLLISITPSQVLGVSGFQPVPPPSTGPTPESGQEDEPPEVKSSSDYYSLRDFYYVEKDGKYTTLNLFPEKLVISFSSYDFLSLPDGKKFLSDMGWLSNVKIEKMELPIGTAEAKHSLSPSARVYVVSFPNSIDVISTLNSLIKHQEISFASPVFLKNHDLVFPAGIWLKTKRINPQQRAGLKAKIERNGFVPPFYSPLQAGLVRINYYRFASFSKENLNVLALSRLLAQDVLVEWAIPDFVSVHPLIVVSPSLSRPSGTMNDPFKITYKIYYDERRISIDIDDLKAQDPMNMKPSGIMNSLFRIEKPVVRELKGLVIFENTFRVYQPGEFFLVSPPIAYTFNGAEAGTPPEKITSDNIFFKISGLVPRDQQGKPLIRDIFDFRKMPYLSVSPPPKPAPAIYPKSDYRYYAKNISRDWPLLSFRIRQGAFSFFTLGILGLTFIALRRLILAARRQREHPYTIFCNELNLFKEALIYVMVMPKDRLQLIAAAQRAMRDMFGFSPGKTNNEMLAATSEYARPTMEKFLSLIEELHVTNEISLEKANLLGELLRTLKRMAKREKH